MNKLALNIASLMIMSITTYAEEPLHLHNEGNNTRIQVQSVRGIVGNNNPIEHARGQLRAGYITLKGKGDARTSGYALGGHAHFDSKRWYGWEVGMSAYTVLNLGINQNDTTLNSDFFDKNGNSFAQLTELYLDGKWGNTELKLGRQILDTPHADSDDIRMMPNYFEAYTLENTDIQGLKLTVGYIGKMAGWENGVDSQKFVNIGETLGIQKIKGVYYASASYDEIKDLSLSLWYYHFTDIAKDVYAEAGYELHLSSTLDIILGIQYDRTTQIEKAFLQKQDAQTFGASMEFVAENLGVHLLVAYNKDTGDTGASGLNLGGGALFTSMEDQTLDAMGQAGEAWVLGAGYHFKAVGIEELNVGLAYGSFKAKKRTQYEAKELDAIIEYSFNDDFSMVAAYASVDFKSIGMRDYKQFRVMSNYNF